MSEKRRALGRGLGALIPSVPPGQAPSRPVDVFFKDNSARPSPAVPAGGSVGAQPARGLDVSRETTLDAGADGAAARVARDATAGTRHGEGADGAGFTGNSDEASRDGAASSGALTAEVGADPRTTGTVVDASGQAGAALDDGLAPVPGARFAELPTGLIRPNPRQPRTVFDDDELAELVHSIREIGVLQPVVVRPIPAEERPEPGLGAGDASGDSRVAGADLPRFELVMGERRWRATQQAGLESIPAIIKETQDDDLLRDALLENLHRSELNALEEAAAYQQLLDDFGCTHEELAGRIGRSRPQISNTLRLLKLPPLVARRVAAGVLSAGHARALLALEDGAAMERLAQRIVAEGLSVRSVEEIVSLGGDDAPRPQRRPRAGNRHPQLDDLAAQLSDRFDTRVSIALGQRKGRLTVEFASVDDLNRIIELLGVDANPS